MKHITQPYIFSMREKIDVLRDMKNKLNIYVYVCMYVYTQKYLITVRSSVGTLSTTGCQQILDPLTASIQPLAPRRTAGPT